MASVSNALPRLFRWVFTVLAVFAVLGAVAICLAILINPKLPVGAHFGPVPHDRFLPHVGFPFGSPIFFSGLLVLALSEVFRQGLALKSENDLTV